MLATASQATTLSQLLAAQPWRTHGLLGCHWQVPIHKAAERTSETQKAPAPAPTFPDFPGTHSLGQACPGSSKQAYAAPHTPCPSIPAAQPLFLHCPSAGCLFLKCHFLWPGPHNPIEGMRFPPGPPSAVSIIGRSPSLIILFTCLPG